jgi:hypothetical protein
MFGLFKKKGLEPRKEYKFLSKDEANKISQDFVDSGKYDAGTLKLIKYIENGINYNASHGFKKYEYGDDGGFSFIKYNFNEDLLRKHFKELGYHIYTYKGTISSVGIYYEIKISWE